MSGAARPSFHWPWPFPLVRGNSHLGLDAEQGRGRRN